MSSLTVGNYEFILIARLDVRHRLRGGVSTESFYKVVLCCFND